MVSAAILEKFQMAIYPQPVVRSTSCLVIGWVFGDGGSNGAIFDSNKFKMVAAAILDNFEWPYLRNGSRSTYIARIARSSLRSHSFLVQSYDWIWPMIWPIGVYGPTFTKFSNTCKTHYVLSIVEVGWGLPQKILRESQKTWNFQNCTRWSAHRGRRSRSNVHLVGHFLPVAQPFKACRKSPLFQSYKLRTVGTVRNLSVFSPPPQKKMFWGAISPIWDRRS